MLRRPRNEKPVPNDPYILAIGSHKGGTGRTTAALALAWHWGRSGVRVTLADCDPIRAAGLVAVANGGCPWSNVRYTTTLPRPADAAYDADLIIVDCPALLTPAARPVLQRATTMLANAYQEGKQVTARIRASVQGIQAASQLDGRSTEDAGPPPADDPADHRPDLAALREA